MIMRYHRQILLAGLIVLVGLVLAPLLRGQTRGPARLYLQWDPVPDWGTPSTTNGVYHVYRRTTPEDAWERVGSTPATTWEITDTQPTVAGVAWRVTAFNGILESEPTEELSVLRPARPGGPPRLILEIR